MSDAIERITALAEAVPNEIVGPITVNAQSLSAQGPVAWGTMLANVRMLNTASGSPDPIIFDGIGGQIELVTGIGLDWRLYAEFNANWPTDRHFQWESDLAGNGQASGQIDPVGQTDLWYFATPAVGPNGELVVSISPLGAQGPGDEFQLSELRFWLFR